MPNVADATRPPSVAADAQCIPPSVTQANSIASIEESNAHSNYEALKSWAHGMQDWAVNAQRDHDAGQPVKPHPAKPDVHRIQVTYANQGGTIETGPRADDGHLYAWIETVIT